MRSVLGRYLEHSRIFRFGEPGAGEVWIGSADLMQRNLDLRVEALVKVDDEALVARIDALLAVYLDPESRVFWLAPDGAWKCTGTIDVQERHPRAHSAGGIAHGVSAPSLAQPCASASACSAATRSAWSGWVSR